MNLIVEAVGYAAFAANVIGNLMLASKSITGWYVRLGTNVLQLTYAACIHSWPMTANAVTFALINLFALIKWRRLQREEEAK